MPKLIDNTVVVHPETGAHALLAAGGELPDWAVKLVGDHLLDTSAGSSAARGGDQDEAARLRARIAELEAAQAANSGGSTPAAAVPVEVPPLRGAGSGATEWRAYARSLGVEVAEDAPRDDVIAALAAAGKPTAK